MHKAKALLFPLLLLTGSTILAADSDPKAAQFVAEIAKALGSSRGLVLEVGSADAGLAIDLAHASEWTVYRVAKDAQAVTVEQDAVRAVGLRALRLRVEEGPLEALEYPRYFANLIVATGLPDASTLKECARLLRPEGILVLVTDQTPAVGPYLKQHAPDAWQAPRTGSGCVFVARAKLHGAAEWSHYFREPGNNRFSPDTHIKEPLRPLWYGEPVQPLGDLFYTQALSAGGRLFLTDASPEDTSRARITCLDAYNGVQLWVHTTGQPRYTKVDGTAEDKRIAAFQLPGRVLPGEMAVTSERLYLADGPHCRILDTATGKEVAAFKAPPPVCPENCWRYVALLDGLLIGYADAPVPMYTRKPAPNATPHAAGGAPALFALDAQDGSPKWVRGIAAGDELGTSFGPPLAIGAGHIFLRVQNTLHALETQSGKTVWRAEGLDDPAPEKATWWEAAVQGETLHLYRYNMRTWGPKKMVQRLVLSAKDGTRLAEKSADLQNDAFFDAMAQFLGAPPAPRLGCNYGSAAGKLYFHRNVYYAEKEGQPNILAGIQRDYGGFRAACGVGVLPANGLVHLLPNGLACGCATLHATAALEPCAELEKVDGLPLPRPVHVASLPAEQAQGAGAADWPTYLGDAMRSGQTNQDLSQPHVLAWETELGGELTPCIAAGAQVFVASSDEGLYALDAASGKVRWRFQAMGAFRAAPVYWNGRVLAGCDDGWLYALGAADGKLLWKLRGAPFARKQVAFESVISPWPLGHGIVVEDGVVYFSAGYIPGQEILAFAADAAGGEVRWRVPLGKTKLVPTGYLMAAQGQVTFPSPGSASVYHPVQLATQDGARLKGHVTHDDFSAVRFVPGCASDAPEYREGFVLHGGGEALTRGYRAGAGYCGGPRQNHKPYHFYLAGWSNKMKPVKWFADGHSFLPLCTPERVVYRQSGALVAAKRAEFFTLLDTPLQRGHERDAFYAWTAKDLPCGEPHWLLGAAASLLAGGPKGVVALAAADGKPLWQANWEGETHAGAIAQSHVYVAAPDGTVRALRALRAK